jgi:D-serine deaminase-like pyridoxal phosphate-dependent protein
MGRSERGLVLLFSAASELVDDAVRHLDLLTLCNWICRRSPQTGDLTLHRSALTFNGWAGYVQAVEGGSVSQLDTPCLVVDLDVFERNVRLCMERLAAVRVRPHLKTAKSPEVARLLLKAGAAGICVAKVSEAEVMLAGGIDDVLITTELAGPIKARRLGELLGRWPDAHVSVVVDSWEGAWALDAAIPRAVDTLIDVNVAQDRCGVLPADARALADRIQELERVRIVGLQGYEGNLQHVRDPRERQLLCDRAMERLASAAQDLGAGGHAVDVVSTGGTGTAEFCAVHDVVTEVQPGSFMFMDVDYEQTGGVPYEPALTALATVVSRPRSDRVVVDAGLKTLSNDSGPARPADPPGWTYHHAGDEHGILTSDRPDGAGELRVGDRVALVPSHIDTTVNLHDVMYAHRNGKLATTWAIAARGKVQ